MILVERDDILMVLEFLRKFNDRARERPGGTVSDLCAEILKGMGVTWDTWTTTLLRLVTQTTEAKDAP